MKFFSRKTTNGFTLVELLVVISIISFLASIVLVSVGAVRQKARDAERISDIKQIQTALQLYFADHQTYPVSLSFLAPTNNNYISKIPTDPLGNDGNLCRPDYCYYFYPGDDPIAPTTYHLGAQLELANVVLYGDRDCVSLEFKDGDPCTLGATTYYYLYKESAKAGGFNGAAVDPDPETIYDVIPR